MPSPRDKLKLFVWDDVLHDYTAGMMVALAHNVHEARSLLIAKCDHIMSSDLAKKPKVVTEPAAFLVWGGG